MTSRLLTIADIKSRLPGVSERTLRGSLMRHGCAAKVGRQLFVTEDQFKRFVEVMTCSKSTNAAAFGTSEAPLPVDVYERALALATATPPSASAIGIEKSSAAPVSDGANLNRHLPNKSKTRMPMRTAVSRG